MSRENNGGPAFPVAGSEHNYPIDGMTLRDYFAAKAMQGVVVNGAFDKFDHIAVDAYRLADAMLRAREAS
ncbi:TPA: hypothetical protein ACH2I9_002414 [Enterobacter asburiae]